MTILFGYAMKTIMSNAWSCEQGKIVNRPLAGTVRRGKTAKEDELAAVQLLSNEKQCAEHIMLVDLGRNDVGKVFPLIIYFSCGQEFCTY